jgi:hypothetical protein
MSNTMATTQARARIGKKQRFWGALRVFGFLGAVNLCFIGASYSTARAAAEGAATRAGQELFRQLGSMVIGNSQGILVNGQRVFIAAKTTDLSAGQVLGLFERHCRDGATEWKAEIDSLIPGKAVLPEELRDFSRVTTSRRDEGDAAGRVACIVPHGDMQGAAGLIHRIEDFASTGDLSRIGDGRVAMVRTDEKTKKTLVVALWTEGEFKLLSMFPGNGDAPGKDSLYAPRPPDAVRLMSAEMEGRPYAMRTYDSKRPRAEVLGSYEKQMSGSGWTSLPMPRAPHLDINENARVYQKDGTAVVIATRDDADGRTTVNVLEMASTGFVRTGAGGGR